MRVQTDLLEAIAGDLTEVEGEEPDVVEREDGLLLIDGIMSAQEAFDRLNLRIGLPRLNSTRGLYAPAARAPSRSGRALRL